MIEMNSLWVNQDRNTYTMALPNGAIVGAVTVPPDGNNDFDYTVVDHITELIAKEYGLLGGEVKGIRQFKKPDNIRVIQNYNQFAIFFNNSIQVADVLLKDDNIITCKIVSGICMILEKRWEGFANRQTVKNNMRPPSWSKKIK